MTSIYYAPPHYQSQLCVNCVYMLLDSQYIAICFMIAKMWLWININSVYACL